jgi:hypothetical protein
MNVYVESGFVLTLALQQDDYQSAAQILRLAQQRHITLKIPTFSLSEPFATVQYRANSRNRLIEEMRREIRELGRTQPHESMAGELGQYTIRMAQVLQTQLGSMGAVVLELSRTCELLQVDATVITRATSYSQTYDLQLQDAIILASIMLDLERTRPSGDALFVSQNVKDFENPAIQDALHRINCKYLADFTNAVRFIERPSDRP